MSRGGAQRQTASSGSTPIWVWVVYALGILGTAILAGSILFTLGALFLSDEGEDFFGNVSVLGFALWGGLMAIAAGLWIWRHRKGRQ